MGVLWVRKCQILNNTFCPKIVAALKRALDLSQCNSCVY